MDWRTAPALLREPTVAHRLALSQPFCSRAGERGRGRGLRMSGPASPSDRLGAAIAV